jgi:hypothetical protein
MLPVVRMTGTVARLFWFALASLGLACGGSSGSAPGNDTGRIGGSGSGAGASAGAGGSDANAGGSDALAGGNAGAGGVADGPGGTTGGLTAMEELRQNAGELCPAWCDKTFQCISRGSSSIADCIEGCLSDATIAAETERCAQLTLSLFDCVLTATCANLGSMCSREFQEAERCSGRTCSMVAPEFVGPPSPGDFMCSQRCEGNSTGIAQETECTYAEAGWTCTCIDDGEALPGVKAGSCEAAFTLCFQ